MTFLRFLKAVWRWQAKKEKRFFLSSFAVSSPSWYGSRHMSDGQQVNWPDRELKETTGFKSVDNDSITAKHFVIRRLQKHF